MSALRYLALMSRSKRMCPAALTCRHSPDLIALRRWPAPGSWLITSV